MSLSSVSSPLFLNERWVLLHRQPRGPRTPPPPPPTEPCFLLRSPILRGADSSEIGKRRFSSTCSTSFPHHKNNNKGRKILFAATVLSSHPPHITLNQSDPPPPPNFIFSSYELISQPPVFLSEGRALMLFASPASNSSIQAEGKGERRDLPGLPAAPICQTHPPR